MLVKGQCSIRVEFSPSLLYMPTIKLKHTKTFCMDIYERGEIGKGKTQGGREISPPIRKSEPTISTPLLNRTCLHWEEHKLST